MKVLITGGRDFTDRRAAERFLSSFHRNHPITLLIHGAARGADRLAASWAFRQRIPCRACPADWEGRGRGAGIIRNAEMLAMGPDVVIAFPGATGTADMKGRARSADVRVIEALPFYDILG